VLLVINRASRRDEVQPGLAGTVTGLRLARTTLPARFRKLEPVLNATPPERADQHPLWPAVLSLGREIDLLPPRRRRRWLPRRARARDRPPAETGESAESESGAGPVEALIAGGFVLLLALMFLQGLLAVFTVVIAGRGANVGARQLGVGGPVESTVHEQLPAGWRRDAAIQIEGEAVRVTLSVPVLLGGGYGDGFLDWRITMRAGTTMEPS
jgi:pilus assembly protein CpaE